MKSTLLSFVFLFLACAVHAQKQLVVLKGQSVLLRLNPGDEIKLKKKGEKRIISSYINNLSDENIYTHRDTIPLNKVDRIYFDRTMRVNVIGGAFVTGGVLLFGIDYINNTLIQGNEASLDRGLTTACITMVGIGLPMVLAKKKSQKLNYKYRLLVAKKGSVFYRPDKEQSAIPYVGQ